MQLAHAYIGRTKWEAEVQAAMVVRALFGDGSASSPTGAPGEYDRVPNGQLLGMMDINLE